MQQESKVKLNAYVIMQNHVHFNPLKAGLEDRPRDWRYSSARNYTGEEGVIPIRRLGECGE